MEVRSNAPSFGRETETAGRTLLFVMFHDGYIRHYEPTLRLLVDRDEAAKGLDSGPVQEKKVAEEATAA